jgi:hypothetical protein
MAVKTLSLRLDGYENVSANFKVREFACKDGSDLILIDDDLVVLLQKIRDYFDSQVNISSAYRTKTHNATIGGSPSSQHVLGKAADIFIVGIAPLQIAQYAEFLQAGGIGHYPAGEGNFCHVDTRATMVRWERRHNKDIVVNGFGGLPESPPPPADYAHIVQQAAGLDDNTMLYLSFYRFGPALIEKLAKAIRKGD